MPGQASNVLHGRGCGIMHMRGTALKASVPFAQYATHKYACKWGCVLAQMIATRSRFASSADACRLLSLVPSQISALKVKLQLIGWPLRFDLTCFCPQFDS
eukprot:2504891-Pleurochrysis_carterae.AAC.3